MTTAVVLIAASFTLVLGEYIFKREALVESNSSLISVLAINSAAAMVFHDPDAATEILSALTADPDVMSAQIYTADLEMYASYSNQRFQRDAPSAGDSADKTELGKTLLSVIGGGVPVANFEDGILDVKGPIAMDDEVLGVIVIQVDLQPLRESVLRQGVIAAVFLLLALVLVYFLARHIQKIITLPIDNLSRAMKKVSALGDYDHRIVRVAKDELGSLSDGFNEMLEQIKNRDRKLDKMVRELQLSKNIAGEYES